jgi:hypothetical protein
MILPFKPLSFCCERRGESECSRTGILVTASVKEDERGGQGHTSARLLHQSAMWHYRAVITHNFYTSDFSSSCFILSAADGKFEPCVCITFCVKLSKSASETLEILHEAFGEHSLSRIMVFPWHSRFETARVSVEDGERSGRPSTGKNHSKC